MGCQQPRQRVPSHTHRLARFGRGFLSVGTNEEDKAHPLIVVESPTEMVVRIDPRKRRVTSALKVYGPIDPNAAVTGTAGVIIEKFATLYLPDRTSWFEKDGEDWVEVDRDEHKLGRVPVIPFFNRRRSGKWFGVSEMADAISLTDAACRTLTNLQVAAETHSVPQRWVLGMSKGDFVDQDGKPLPVWQAYFGAIWSNQNAEAKVGQFSASDLRNFHETTTHYASLLAGLYGLPVRYLGQNTANPPSADGIRADEARLVKRAERKMSAAGDQLGRAMAYALRIRDGVWPETGDRIKVEWFDAATPTFAAKVDGIQKLTGGKPILSREGGWDELGWSEPRKLREKQHLDDEAADPLLEKLAGTLADRPRPPRPMVPQSALNHQHNQRRLATLTAAANVRIWASMGDDFDASWSELAPRLTAVTTAGQLAAARLADPYLRAVLAETGQPNRPVAAVRARGFAGIAADGRPLTGLLAGAVIKAKLARQETSTVEALARGGRWLQLVTDTTIADTARSAVTVGITNRPELDGYVRSTGSLACSRCSVLAGKFYRYSAGFLRHPRCHCINTPVYTAARRRLRRAPRAHFTGRARQSRRRRPNP
jgi:hypothetical protein